MNNFRIAHLSDLHLTAKDGAARSEPKLFGALTGMNANFRKIIASKDVQESDLVLVTGDVTDRGDMDTWKFFWDTVKQANIEDRVRVIPGNHDVCCLGARLPLKRKQYREQDTARVHKGLLIGNQPTKFPWAYNPDPRVVVFGLNSNNLGNFTAATNAMGDIGYYQLKDLATLLHKHRDVPVKIIAMHHSPNIPEEQTAIKRGQRPFSQLDRIGHQVPESQRRMLNLLCVTHKVRLLLHGHLHQSEDRRITGVRYIGASASTEPHHSPEGAILQFPTYKVSAKTHRVYCNTAIVPL